tara:strand:- start:8355 stop:10133 length:1779 start_codon:yes stop_codon:yes gene_type:complete
MIFKNARLGADTANTAHTPGANNAILAISPEPLEVEAKNILATRFGLMPDVMSIPDLRAEPMMWTIRRLRARRIQTLVLVCEAEVTAPIMPILKVFSLLLGARETLSMGHDAVLVRVSTLQKMAAIITTLVAFAEGMWMLRQSRKEVAALVNAPRMADVGARGGDFVFIKVTPMSGGAFGGALAHFLGIVNGFARLGYKCVAVTTGGMQGVHGSVELVSVPAPSRMAPPLRLVQSASEMNTFRLNHGYVDFLRTRFSKHAPTVIYQRLTLGTYCGVVLSRRFGVPLIMEYNGSEAWVAANWGRRLVNEDLAYDVERVCVRHAHVVVCVSTVLRDDLINMHGVDPERIVCHPNGVDADVYNPIAISDVDRQAVRAQYEIDEDALLITFIGSFGKWHGVDVFAKAISWLVHNKRAWLDKENVRFMLIGDGAYRPVAEKILAEARAEKYVALTGAIPQAEGPKYLATADLFICSHVANDDQTPFFGSPTKLFEYLAMAKPVIASDLAQIGEIMSHCPDRATLAAEKGDVFNGECGIRVTPGDSVDLAEAIVLAAERSSWREQAGKAARECILKHYTWDHHVAAVESRLKGLGDGS